MRRRVTRLLLDDLDILEDFSHLTRHDRPPLSRGGIFGSIRRRERSSRPTAIARPPPASGASPCLGSRTRLRQPTAANGLRFEYRGSFSPPPRSSRVRDGVYRLLDGRFRVQLGDDWGFLGNYASEGAAMLVADRARRRPTPPAAGPLPTPRWIAARRGDATDAGHEDMSGLPFPSRRLQWVARLRLRF